MSDFFTVCKLLGEQRSLNVFGKLATKINLPEINTEKRRKNYEDEAAAEFFRRNKKTNAFTSKSENIKNTSKRKKEKQDLATFKAQTKSRIQECLKTIKQKQMLETKKHAQEEKRKKNFNDFVQSRNKELYSRKNLKPKNKISQPNTSSNTCQDIDDRMIILKTIQKLETSYRYARNRKAKKEVKQKIKALKATLMKMNDHTEIHKLGILPKINTPFQHIEIAESPEAKDSQVIDDISLCESGSEISYDKYDTKKIDDRKVIFTNVEENISNLNKMLILHRRHPTDSDFTKLCKFAQHDEMLLPCVDCGWKTICSKNWAHRIDTKCSKCLNKHYLPQVRSFRQDCYDVLQQKRKNLSLSSKNTIECETWF